MAGFNYRFFDSADGIAKGIENILNGSKVILLEKDDAGTTRLMVVDKPR